MALATVGALALAADVRRAVATDAGRRRPVRLRARRVRQRRRLQPTPGRTGSPPGPATPRSSSAGCSTSRSSSTRAACTSCWSIVHRAGRPVDPGARQPDRRVATWASVQVWTTVLKFVPLAFMVDRRAVLHQHRQLHAVEHQRRHQHVRDRRRAWRSACSATSASRPRRSPRRKVRNPERNVPRATIYGTLGSAVVYLLSLIAVFGIVPSTRAGQDVQQASYSAAANTIVGGSWAGLPGGRSPSSSPASAP